jgi:hypothetical protein
MDEFERLTHGVEPEVQFREITNSGGEQIRRAIAGLIVTATVCAGLTWLCWIVPAAVRWWGT